MNDIRECSLATLLGGGAVERFDDEIKRVVENILDPNTEPKAKRSVTLTVTIEPTLERDKGVVVAAVKTKLAPPKKDGTLWYFGRRNGRAAAIEQDPQQPKMFEEEPAKPRAVDGGKK
jgi:hypothetical protein